MRASRVPVDVDALDAQAQRHLRAGDRARAADVLRQALAADPDAAAPKVALGEILFDEGCFAEAFKLFTAVIKATGGRHFRALRGAAAAALATGHLPAGLVFAEQALALAPEDPQALRICGHLLSRAGRPGDAVSHYERVLAHHPRDVELLLLTGRHLAGTARADDGIACLDRALKIDRDCPEALVAAAADRIATARLHEHDRARQDLKRLLRVDSPIAHDTLATAAYFATFVNLGATYDREIRRRIETNLATRGPAAHVPAFPDGARSRDRLRIGYVFPRFGNHPIGQATHAHYGHHDRARFEVFLYATAERAEEASTYAARIRERCDTYRAMGGASSAQLARRIHEDGIDVLVDLNGYMRGGRAIVEAFSLRPAPLQLYWLGHGGVLGLSCYDYVVGDATVTPPGEHAQHPEKVLRLPHSFCPACPDEIAAQVPLRADHGLAPASTVFCAFNNPAKIDRTVFAAWMRILRAVPGSQLWLSAWFEGNPAVRNLRRAAEAAGVDGARLVFARKVPGKAEHFARHRLADLFLDTFTVNAATTCLDALWAGLPVLTRPGRDFCSRIGASILRTAGLEALIVDSTDAYVDTAVALANDPCRLAALKERVRLACERSALFDTERFTRTFEAGVLAIWQRYSRGEAADDVTVRAGGEAGSPPPPTPPAPGPAA